MGNRLEKSSVYDFAKYESNPYTDVWAKKMLVDNRLREKKYFKQSGTLVDESGEVVQEGNLLIGVEKLVDKERFVKIYLGSLMMFNDLSKRAALLFTVILRHLEKNMTRVYLVPEEMMKEMRCSDSTYYRSIVELLDAEMLARSSGSNIIYYINPAFMFNGNRMTIVHHFVKDQKSPEPDGEVNKESYYVSPNEGFDDNSLAESGGKALGLAFDEVEDLNGIEPPKDIASLDGLTVEEKEELQKTLESIRSIKT